MSFSGGKGCPGIHWDVDLTPLQVYVEKIEAEGDKVGFNFLKQAMFFFKAHFCSVLNVTFLRYRFEVAVYNGTIP